MAPKKTTKRPAAAGEATGRACKKAWCDWASTDGSAAPGGDDGEGAQASGDDVASVASSATQTITPQQRHVFKKALQGLPGMPTTLPPEVKEQWEAASARGPKAKAAVANSVIAKDVQYGDAPIFTEVVLKRFRETFELSLDKTSAVGVTYTKLKAELGGGKAGEQAIDEGIARNDIVEKNGLFYMRTHEVSRETSDRSGHSLSGQQDLEQRTYEETADSLAIHDWAQFALLGRRTLALRDKHDEELSKPPSEEAQNMCHDAYDKTTRAIMACRKCARGLTNIGASNTTRTTIDAVLSLCKDMDTGKIADLGNSCCSDMYNTTYEDVKLMLRRVAMKYNLLEQHERELSALLRQAQRQRKGT